MKKIISIILAMLMVFSCLAVLSSCDLFGGGENESESGDAPGGDNSGSDASVEYLNLVTNGASDYQVVMGNGCTSAVSSIASTLVDAIKEASEGVKLKRVTDKKATDAKPNEIIIGKTTRAESDQVLAGVPDIGWRIKVVGNKLVIVASNDYMLAKACEAFVSEIIVKEGNTVKIDKNIDRSYDGSADMIPLYGADGKFTYKIIYSGSSGKAVRDAADKLKDKLRSMFNGDRSIGISLDSAKETDYEILVGKTSRTPSKDLYASMDMLDMRSMVEGTKILVGAASDANMDTAVNTLCNGINELVKGTYNGKYAIPKDYQNIATTVEYMAGVPMPNVGEFKGEDEVGDGTHIYVWDGVDATQYATYKSELDGAMTKVNDYEMDGNKYGLYNGEKATVYLSYLASQKQMRLFCQNSGNKYPAKEQPSYTTVSGYKPTFYMLDVDNKNGGGTDETGDTNGANGGMSFALKLADGTFALIDGGYCTDVEGDRIYNFLKDNTPEGQIPVVSAWIITHQHGDHYGALQNITKRYLNKINVKAFYLNVPFEGHEGAGYAANSIYGTLDSWKNATIYNKIHSGMTFYVVDAKFECIFTHEDIYPATMSSVNDTSMVFRITHGGKKIMMLGDAEDVASSVMEKNWTASFLKSDIVQYSHHGYEGCNKALYDMIAAPTVLWPVNTYSWQSNNAGDNIFKSMVKNGGYNGLANYYIANEASYVKAIICAEEAHYEPYAIDLLTYEPPKPVYFSDFSRSDKIYISNYVDLYNKVKASDA